MKLLEPTTDYVFKRIFGYSGNEKITEGLLSAILERPVTNLNLDSTPILERDLIDDKLGILDVKAKFGDSTVCDIEMQVVDEENLIQRLLFYWGELYTKNAKKGKDYIELKKTIVIMFADFELDDFRKIKKYITNWEIREKDYVDYVLTDMFQLFIIEIPKITKYRKNTELDTWVNFIRNPEVIDMDDEKNSEAIKEAKKVLEDISQDERERYLAELRLKYIMDQKAIQRLGYKKGVKDGILQGIAQIVLNMYNKKIPIEDIAKFTNEEIEKIKEIIEKNNN